MRSLCLLLTLLLAVTSVQANEYFDGRFAPGYEWLKQGEFDKALENFEQLKTDMPDSELVDYSIASVAYQRALALRDNDNAEGAIEQFSAAKTQFTTLAHSNDEFLREYAPLNAANSTAQMAKLYNPEQQYKERVQGLKEALNEYDSILGRFPGNAAAQRNRDHVSYLLKQLLRNPPPEEEQEEKGEGEDEDSEEQEDQEKQDQDTSGEDQENEDDSNGENSEDKEQEDSESDDSQSNAEDASESESSNPQQSEEGKSPEEQNIEAILESLEAINAEEQKNLRKAKRYPSVKKGGKWW